MSDSVSYTSRHDLPTLYKLDGNNKERMWKNWVVDNTVHTLYGLVDGKHIPKQRSFKGKFLGKKNEVTAAEQALLEANKAWIKQIEKGYAPRDEEGLAMLARLQSAKKATGGHNINAVASVANSSARKLKTLKRDSNNTQMVQDYSGTVPVPMKAKTWLLSNEKDPASVKMSVARYFNGNSFYGQPKLDGWRVVAKCFRDAEGKYQVILTSNGGKQYPWFADLRAALCRLAERVDDWEDITLDGLDGELYVQVLRDEQGRVLPESARFGTLSSICGLYKSEPSALENQLQLNVFDIVDLSGKRTQEERFALLDRVFEKVDEEIGRFITRVPTEVLDTVDEVPQYLDRMTEAGYEGVIVRTRDLKYQAGKKAADMRKFKYFIDAEYEVVGALLDEGVDEEYFVWICKVDLELREWKEKEISVPSDKRQETFRATPMGSQAEKRRMYKNRASYFGRKVTVKFQEFSENGVPRFPIAKAFRESGDI